MEIEKIYQRAINNGNGSDMFLALFQLLKLHVSPDPKKEIEGVAEEVEAWSGISRSKSDMYDSLMWMGSLLPEGFDLSILNDPDNVTKLASDSRSINSDSRSIIDRRQQQEEPKHAERPEEITNDDSLHAAKMKEKIQIGNELGSLQQYINSPEKKEIYKGIVSSFMKGTLDFPTYSELKKKLQE